MQKLSDAGVSARPGDVPWSLVIESPVTLTELESFRAGEFYIQDTSAMRAPEALAPKPAEKVLDLCAAPGGKTTQLAEITLGRARIFALDESPERLRLVEENASRLGITCIRTGIGNARKIADPWRATFGATLADVPCSNTGVLRRRVEARHRLTPDDITRLADMQADILETALLSVRPGGRVVYSTCSIEPEENGELVRRLLARHTTLLLDFEETVLPEAEGPDGAYIARLTDTRRG
jgi:16S rRNA (cytosine967-C5)-methyltransferase